METMLMHPGVPNWATWLSNAGHAAYSIAALLLCVAGFLFWRRSRRWEFGVLALAGLCAAVIWGYIVFVWYGPQLPQAAENVVGHGYFFLRGWLWPIAQIGAFAAAIKICLFLHRKDYLPTD